MIFMGTGRGRLRSEKYPKKNGGFCGPPKSRCTKGSPRPAPGTGPVLQEGMTLAIEPMVNLGDYRVRVDDDGWTIRTADGYPSAHFEHTVLVTGGEPEILTK